MQCSTVASLKRGNLSWSGESRLICKDVIFRISSYGPEDWVGFSPPDFEWSFLGCPVGWDKGASGSVRPIGPGRFFAHFFFFPRFHLFPPSYHSQEVVIRIKMAEFIVAFQRQPEVRSKMQFPVLFQVHRQRYLDVASSTFHNQALKTDLRLKLGEGLSNVGNCKVTSLSSLVPS